MIHHLWHVFNQTPPNLKCSNFKYARVPTIWDRTLRGPRSAVPHTMRGLRSTVPRTKRGPRSAVPRKERGLQSVPTRICAVWGPRWPALQVGNLEDIPHNVAPDILQYSGVWNCNVKVSKHNKYTKKHDYMSCSRDYAKQKHVHIVSQLSTAARA